MATYKNIKVCIEAFNCLSSNSWLRSRNHLIFLLSLPKALEFQCHFPVSGCHIDCFWWRRAGSAPRRSTKIENPQRLLRRKRGSVDRKYRSDQLEFERGSERCFGPKHRPDRRAPLGRLGQSPPNKQQATALFSREDHRLGLSLETAPHSTGTRVSPANMAVFIMERAPEKFESNPILQFKVLSLVSIVASHSSTAALQIAL